MHVIWRHQKTNTAYVAAVLRWWAAVDAPADSDEHHVRSLPGVFRTQEDALPPGWHEWETNYTQATATHHLRGADWRATGLSCETTHL